MKLQNSATLIILARDCSYPGRLPPHFTEVATLFQQSEDLDSFVLKDIY